MSREFVGTYDLSIVCVYNKEDQFKAFCESFANSSLNIQLLAFDNRNREWPSAASAYNEGVHRTESDAILFSHQDIVFVDDSFLLDFVNRVRSHPRELVGVAGAVLNDAHDGRSVISGMYQGSLLWRHHTAEELTFVDTLDECLFGANKAFFDEVKFDEECCDGWHFYAVDLSLQAKVLQRDVSVVPARVLHLSGGNRDASYYLAQEKVKAKYRSHFDAFATTCGYTKTEFVDPYRPIAADEINALLGSSVPAELLYDRGLLSSLGPSNGLFALPSDLAKACDMCPTSLDLGYLQDFCNASGADIELYDSMAKIKNYLAGKLWLYRDLYDLKRDYSSAVRDEMENSKSYRFGSRFLPFARVGTTFDVSVAGSGNAPVFSGVRSIESIDFEEMDCALGFGVDCYLSLLRLYFGDAGSRDYGVFGQELMRVFKAWFNASDSILFEICDLIDADRCREAEANTIRRAYERSLPFRLGSFVGKLSRIGR